MGGVKLLRIQPNIQNWPTKGKHTKTDFVRNIVFVGFANFYVFDDTVPYCLHSQGCGKARVRRIPGFAYYPGPLGPGAGNASQVLGEGLHIAIGM